MAREAIDAVRAAEEAALNIEKEGQEKAAQILQAAAAREQEIAAQALEQARAADAAAKALAAERGLAFKAQALEQAQAEIERLRKTADQRQEEAVKAVFETLF